MNSFTEKQERGLSYSYVTRDVNQKLVIVEDISYIIALCNLVLMALIPLVICTPLMLLVIFLFTLCMGGGGVLVKWLAYICLQHTHTHTQTDTSLMSNYL